MPAAIPWRLIYILPGPGQKGLWLCLMLSLMILSGCSTPMAVCDRQLTPVWANRVQLQQDMAMLSSKAFQGRKTGTWGAKLTRDYLRQRFREVGLRPWGDTYAHPFDYRYQFTRRRGINMLGIIPAAVPDAPWRIVLAHYDHLGSRGASFYPGADDNASGVAALLQLAQHASRQTLASNLMFVATDAEEPGLFGSRALVEKIRHQMAAADIELVLNLDMISHPGRAYAIYLEGSRRFRHFNRIRPMLSAENGLCIRLSHPRPVGRSVSRTDWLRASDHYPFHRAGFPWLYFGVPAHGQYHTQDDTLEKTDLPFLAAVTESSFKLLRINSGLLQN